MGVTQIISFELPLLGCGGGGTAFASVTEHAIEAVTIFSVFFHLRLRLQSCELYMCYSRQSIGCPAMYSGEDLGEIRGPPRQKELLSPYVKVSVSQYISSGSTGVRDILEPAKPRTQQLDKVNVLHEYGGKGEEDPQGIIVFASPS